jgi:hypothetical protein
VESELSGPGLVQAVPLDGVATEQGPELTASQQQQQQQQ